MLIGHNVSYNMYVVIMFYYPYMLSLKTDQNPFCHTI